MKASQELTRTHILLQCHDPNHDGSCVELRDSLLEKFGDVEKAITVKQTTGEQDFCVFAVATIDPSKVKSFESALSKLQANENPNSKVQDIRVDMEVS